MKRRIIIEVKQVIGLLKAKKEGRETSTVKLSESLEKAVSQMKTGTKGSVWWIYELIIGGWGNDFKEEA